MAAAFNDRSRGDECQPCLLLKFRNRERSAVAHSRAHLIKGRSDALGKCAGIRYIAVHAFLKAELCCAAQVVSLPVACTVGTFAPVLLHVVSANTELARRTLIKSCKITAEHDEVSTHCQCKCNMIIVNDTAVRADRDVNTCLFKIFIPRLCYLDDCRSLSAADTLGLTRDADGTSTDTDLYKVRASLCKEQETVSVDDITGTDLDAVAVMFTDPGNRSALPLAEALGRIDTENVRSCFNQCRNTLCVVSCIDTRSDNIALIGVEKLIDIFLMAVIILAENDVLKLPFFIDERQSIDLVIPDNIIAVMERRSRRCCDKVIERCHKISHLAVA